MKNIEAYFKKKFNLEINKNLNEISTNLNNSKSNQIIFYRINDSSEDLFYSRLNQGNPGFIFVNKKLTKKIAFDYLVLNGSEFDLIQKELVDLVYPIESMPKIIGVTGTNGKTSVCFFGMQIANQYKIKSIAIGTVGVYGEVGKLRTEHITTTPSYIELRKILFENQPELVWIEVSSHALDQNRLKEIKLDIAGWTNLTQDHLDYHKDMKSYFEAKLKILTILKNVDNLLVCQTSTNLISLLKENKTNFSQVDLIDRDFENKFLNLDFNKNNISLAERLFFSIYPEKKFRKDINYNNLSEPPGRMNFFYKGPNSIVIVDYAHTPDAVEKALLGIRKTFLNYIIKSVVGCGGDRDKSKRPLMSNTACTFSDEVYFTSDNPRSEKPIDILNDMTVDLKFKNFCIIEDRQKAIEKAFKELGDFEILLILGKGHEEYQEISGIKHPFSDTGIIKTLINGD